MEVQKQKKVCPTATGVQPVRLEHVYIHTCCIALYTLYLCSYLIHNLYCWIALLWLHRYYYKLYVSSCSPCIPFCYPPLVHTSTLSPSPSFFLYTSLTLFPFILPLSLFSLLSFHHSSFFPLPPSFPYSAFCFPPSPSVALFH